MGTQPTGSKPAELTKILVSELPRFPDDACCNAAAANGSKPGLIEVGRAPAKPLHFFLNGEVLSEAGKRRQPRLVANLARDASTSTPTAVKAGPQAEEMFMKMGSVSQLELPTSEPPPSISQQNQVAAVKRENVPRFGLPTTQAPPNTNA